MIKRTKLMLIESRPDNLENKVDKPDFNPPPQKAEREKKKKTPYKCPVCEGKGLLPCGYYSVSKTKLVSDDLVEECKSCKSTGIVWR